VLALVTTTAFLAGVLGVLAVTGGSGRSTPAVAAAGRLVTASPTPPPTPQGHRLSPPGWTITVHHLASGGLGRYYEVARPVAAAGGPSGSPASSKATPSLPVLVVLHGRVMSPANIMAVTHFLAVVGPAIVVFPSGYDESWNAGYCCGGAQRAGVNDVAFLRAVVDQILVQQPGATPGRVYLAGFSNGGRMAYRMACDAPGLFAGVAAVEAVSVSPCPSTIPVPLLIVAASGDPLLTIGYRAPPKHVAGHVETTVQGEIATWRTLDGCGPQVATATLGDLHTQTWDHCTGHGRVEAATYGGGKHAWFQGCQATPSAEGVIWAFFHQQAPLAGPGGPRCPMPSPPRLAAT
jgi:polyhydroxybutyrate depolymerase